MMQISPAGEAFIKGFETLRLTAYLPTPQDVPTIGWGHTGPTVKVGDVITEEEAELLFLSDTATAQAAANQANAERMAEYPPLLQPMFDALTSLIFNIGREAFAESHLRKAIVAADEAATHTQWSRWCHQHGRVLEDLVRRRAAEWAMWANGAGTVT